MYSFAQLGNVRVIDEPLYGHYLRVSEADHPGREKVMNAMNCNGNAVMQDLLQQQVQDPARRLFIKHMAHHLLGLDLGFLNSTTNIFLVRDPREMLPSLTIQIPQASLVDTGLKRQWELFHELSEEGQQAVVLDARELLLNPSSVLRQLCSHLGFTFGPDMLTWQAGPRPEDGVWAPYWYHAVHKSTGFAAYVAKPEFPEHLQELLHECEPFYEKLYQHALRAEIQGDNE